MEEVIKVQKKLFDEMLAENKELKEQHELLIGEFQKQKEDLCKQIKQESDARKRFVKEDKRLKEQLKENKIKTKDVYLSELKTECGKHAYRLYYNGTNTITGIRQFTIETVEVAISAEDTRITMYDEYGNGHEIGSYYLTIDEAVEAWKEQIKGENK